MSSLFYAGHQIDSTASQAELAQLISDGLTVTQQVGRPVFVDVPVKSGVQKLLIGPGVSILLRADVTAQPSDEQH